MALSYISLFSVLLAGISFEKINTPIPRHHKINSCLICTILEGSLDLSKQVPDVTWKMEVRWVSLGPRPNQGSALTDSQTRWLTGCVIKLWSRRCCTSWKRKARGLWTQTEEHFKAWVICVQFVQRSKEQKSGRSQLLSWRPFSSRGHLWGWGHSPDASSVNPQTNA